MRTVIDPQHENVATQFLHGASSRQPRPSMLFWPCPQPHADVDVARSSPFGLRHDARRRVRHAGVRSAVPISHPDGMYTGQGRATVDRPWSWLARLTAAVALSVCLPD